MLVKSQWRGAGMGVIGLDYSWVVRIAAEMKIPRTPALYGKLAALETATMKRINARPEK
mgnify:CR=1 FL=1